IGTLAATELLKRPTKSEIIDLHGPAYTINQVAAKLGGAIGKTLQVVNIPQPEWLPALLQAGLPQPLAEAYAEMYAGFGSGKIQPKGDRFVQGTTEIDATMAERVRHVVKCCFDGKRVIIFSGGETKDNDDAVLDDIRAIRDGGGYGSIIGRNAFQRPFAQGKKLLTDIMDIYAK
ncbi:MAG TPA: hypothetical protein PLY80_04450, partial [Pseudomonadota bacterium]|nr:hypothetical protein [Pseudomonadota bacterium]